MPTVMEIVVFFSNVPLNAELDAEGKFQGSYCYDDVPLAIFTQKNFRVP